jgi:hypothetical protein
MRTGESMLVRAVSSGRLYIGTMADVPYALKFSGIPADKERGWVLPK